MFTCLIGAPDVVNMEIKTLRPEQNTHNFVDNIFKYIFESFFVILPAISLKFVPDGAINGNSALDQVMAWRRTGDKSLTESMMTPFCDAI